MTATPIHDELVSALRRRTDSDVVSPSGAPELDDVARGTLALALEEAVAGGRARWGTGHLLLGLLRGGDAVADLLHAAGITTDGTRRSVQRHEAAGSGGHDDTLAATAQDCSPAAAGVVDTARAEAWARGNGAGTADLLAALLDVPTGAAAGVLATPDVPRDELAEVARALAARSAPEAAPRRWRDPSRLHRRH